MKYVIINKQRTSYDADVEFLKALEEQIGEQCFYMFCPFNQDQEPNYYKMIEEPIELALFHLVLEKEEKLSEIFQKLNDAQTLNQADWYNNKRLKFCGRRLNIPSPPFRFVR